MHGKELFIYPNKLHYNIWKRSLSTTNPIPSDRKFLIFVWHLQPSLIRTYFFKDKSQPWFWMCLCCFRRGNFFRFRSWLSRVVTTFYLAQQKDHNYLYPRKKKRNKRTIQKSKWNIWFAYNTLKQRLPLDHLSFHHQLFSPHHLKWSLSVWAVVLFHYKPSVLTDFWWEHIRR